MTYNVFGGTLNLALSIYWFWWCLHLCLSVYAKMEQLLVTN